MNILDLQDEIEQGSYRSDRAPMVPFTTLENLMHHAQSVLDQYDPADDWQGVITPSCWDRRITSLVSHDQGIALRVGGEANLCFDCGPDGGHYHPVQGETMKSVLNKAASISRTNPFTSAD